MSSFNFNSTGDQVAQAFKHRIQGRTFLITGTSKGGLGAGIVKALAQHGPAHLVLVSRSREKTEPVIKEVEAANENIRITFLSCELSDFDSVRETAARINNDASITKIDVVINNAGVMAIQDYTVDKQGYEMQLSANHLGHFILTNSIMPKILAAGRETRIVNVSSDGYQFSYFHFDDFNFSDGKTYNDLVAYGQSKTANILYSVALAKRLSAYGVGVFAAHPGAIMTTGLTAHFKPDVIERLASTALKVHGRDIFVPEPADKTLEQGTAPILAAALDSSFAQASGSYVKDCQLTNVHDYAKDEDNARKLWVLSAELVKQEFQI